MSQKYWINCIVFGSRGRVFWPADHFLLGKWSAGQLPAHGPSALSVLDMGPRALYAIPLSLTTKTHNNPLPSKHTNSSSRSHVVYAAGSTKSGTSIIFNSLSLPSSPIQPSEGGGAVDMMKQLHPHFTQPIEHASASKMDSPSKLDLVLGLASGSHYFWSS
jgi:hypothetical protein